MRVSETSGRTVDEAVGKDLNQLGLRRDQVDVDVITEGKAGFLGFGSEDAMVRETRAYLDFFKSARPVPGVAVPKFGSATLCLLEKKEGSKPLPQTADTRRHERHWTPVHLELHVPDLDAALARAIAAGARQEQVFRDAEHGSAAFCSDPFGHMALPKDFDMFPHFVQLGLKKTEILEIFF